jgi:two-component sensor histidine kinase
LSRVQSLLARIEDQSVDLHALVSAELAAHADNDSDAGKIHVSGPPVALPAMAAQALGLALHELATNAVKYGALAQASGRLAIAWEIKSKSEVSRVALDWVESGVDMPPAAVPKRKGYGSELIERALPYQLRAKTRLDFHPDGVRCAIEVPVQWKEVAKGG